MTKNTLRALVAVVGLSSLLAAGCGMFDRLGIAWQIKNATPVPCTTASIYFFDAADSTVYGASTNLDLRVGLQIGPDLNAKVLNSSGRQAHAATEIAYAVAQCYAPFDPNHPVATRFASSERVVPVMESGSMWFHMSITKSDTVPVVADRDGDGVIDTLDKCIDVKGLPENDGCPATPPPPVPPTGDCAAVPTGTRDSMYSSFVCWPTVGGSVLFSAAKPLDSLNSLPREWVDTGKFALPPIVRLNTSGAVSTTASQFDKTGTMLAPLNDMFSTKWYTFQVNVAVIKSNLAAPTVDFKTVASDMAGKLLEIDCPTGTIVAGADTCQP